MTEKEIEEIKSKAIKYDKHIRNINILLGAISYHKELGENYSFDYNNETFYSLLDDADSVYIRLTGVTRDEYEEWAHQEKLKKEELKKEETRKKIPEYIKQGGKYIYPQRYKKWEEYIEIRVEDSYYGKDIEEALQCMELLETGESFQDVYDVIKSFNQDGQRYSIVMSMLTIFSKSGTEFYRFVDREPSNATIKFLEKIEKENEQFIKELVDSGIYNGNISIKK